MRTINSEKSYTNTFVTNIGPIQRSQDQYQGKQISSKGFLEILND